MQFDRVRAGDSIAEKLITSSCPAADGWTAFLHMLPMAGGAGAPVILELVGQDDGWAISETSAQTASWQPCWMSWVILAFRGSERVTLAIGTVEVLPDPAQASTLDARTVAVRALEDARKALASWTPTVRSYTIAGRSMTFNDAAEILTVISYWENQVRAERAAAGVSPRSSGFIRIGVRRGV